MQNVFKAAVRTKIRRSHSLKLSSAWLRSDDVSSARFLNRPANNQKKSDSYENTQSMARNRFSLLSIDALLQIWSSQSMKHVQVVVKSHSSLVESIWFLISGHFVDLFRTWMTSSRSFTMRAFIIIISAYCSFVFCEIGCDQAYLSLTAVQVTSTVNAASGNQLAQSDALHLLRLPMRRQISQTQSKQTERFLNFKCINCNFEFASLRSLNAHRLHRSSRGTPCSEESSKSEVIFAGRAGLATGIVRQHSLANAKTGESFTITFQYNK